MPIKVCTCRCGSTDQLARQTLKRYGYPDWLSIPIPQGKEASRRLLEQIPRYPEIEMLDNYLQSASKWVVIIGYGDGACRWTDIAHNGQNSRIEAEFIISTFSDLQ